MMNKKKIMHVAQSAGGVCRYLESFLMHSNKEKYEIVLVLSEDYKKYKEKLEQLASTVEIISAKRDISLKDDLKSISAIKSLIRKYNPDLIYAHSSKAGALVRLACLTNTIPIIYNPHGWAFNMKTSNRKQSLYQLIEKLLAFRTNTIINISKYELNTALKRKIAPLNKMQLIYNGIDIHEHELMIEVQVQTFEKLKQLSEGKFVIGAVGRISEQKSPLDFVQVAQKIITQIPNAIFIWVGDGDDRVEMEKMIEQYQLKNKVIITGWVENPALYIKLFDIGLLLSAWEGFGLVLTEYMLYKKPIIATRVDAIPELVEHGVNGFTVELHDTNSISEYIMKYLNDESLRKNHAQSSYYKVKKQFNIERVIKEHNEIFERILGE